MFKFVDFKEFFVLFVAFLGGLMYIDSIVDFVWSEVTGLGYRESGLGDCDDLLCVRVITGLRERCLMPVDFCQELRIGS